MKPNHDQWANAYDILNSDVLEDIPFWIEQSQQCDGKVLEVGCGTGRVTIPVAESNLDITGIDISPTMLKKLTEKSLHEQIKIRTQVMDMREINLNDFFDLIIVPYRGFQHMLTTQDQEKSLFSMHKRLTKRGRLIVNIFPPNIDMFDQSTLIYYETKTIKLVEEQQELQVRHRVEIDMETQHIDTSLMLRHKSEGAIIKDQYFDFELRYLYQKEAEYLFKNCGYKIIDLFGDYERNPYRPESADMIWILEKTG